MTIQLGSRDLESLMAQAQQANQRRSAGRASSCCPGGGAAPSDPAAPASPGSPTGPGATFSNDAAHALRTFRGDAERGTPPPPAAAADPASLYSASSTPAAAPARTNQDVINDCYRQGGGTWAGAQRVAQAQGLDLNALVKNRAGAATSGSPSQSPSPSSQSPSSPSSPGTGAQRPGTTTGAQNTQAVGDRPADGSIGARIADATRRYMGTSTRAGPDGGNLACAWAVNNILKDAGLAKIGSNTNLVRSVEDGLKGGRGQQVSAAQAKPGDIVIWPAPRSHIGIMMENGKVANNSSSRASFTNMTTLPPGARIYRVVN